MTTTSCQCEGARRNCMHEYPSLTAVCQQVAKNAPSGVDMATIADLLGMPYSTFTSQLARHGAHKLSADKLLPLMDICESDLPIIFLARQRGGVYLRVPPGTGGEPGPLVQQLAASVKEFGEFAAEAAADVADGDIPADQLARIIKEGHEAVEAIMALISLARKTNEAQYGA